MSSRIASMKFMQRKEESTQREKLELLRKQQEQDAQWTSGEKSHSKSSKKPRFEEVGETTNSKSATLYSDKTVLNNTVPARKTEISQREVVEFRDEISKLRMGRRTFGGFNPVLEVRPSFHISSLVASYHSYLTTFSIYTPTSHSMYCSPFTESREGARC